MLLFSKAHQTVTTPFWPNSDMVSPHKSRPVDTTSQKCVDPPESQAKRDVTASEHLTTIVRDAYLQSVGQGLHCAITSRAKSFNAPYNFKEATCLFPGRQSHRGPLVFAVRDRESGINDIREHFLKLKGEHAWIYVPQAGIWIDDTTKVDDHSVSSDPFLRTVLLRAFPEIEVFHTHPDALYQSLHNDGHLPETYLTIAATPSRGDQFGAAMLEDFAGKRANLKSHIISHYGVTSYQRTAEFRADENLRACPFDWDFSDIEASVAPAEEIARICRNLQENVAASTPSGAKILTWKIDFTPFP